MSIFLQPLQTVTVGSGGASSISFNSIPQGYTDLKLVYSARTTDAATDVDVSIRFNSDSGSNYSYTRLYGNSSASYSDRNSTTNADSRAVGLNATLSTFGNCELYIPNYTSSNYKSFTTDAVGENNLGSAGSAYQFLIANLWRGTSAITSITLTANFAQYSTFALYGVLRQGI